MRKLDYNYVLNERAKGSTLQEIGNNLGVSRQRIQQICKKHNIVKPQEIVELTPHGVRKAAFTLSPELFSSASLRFSRKKQNSKSQKWGFDIKFEEIVWPTHCPILGIELDYEQIEGRTRDNSVSFDRINPNLGYIPGNVQILSWRANRIKNDGTAEEHLLIHQHMISQTL